jgi:AraC-like DNA-binding protein
VGDTELVRWAGDCRQLCVKIEKGALERGLAQLLGEDVTSSVLFAPTLDVRDGPGRSWARLVQTIAAEACHADSVMHQPLVAPQLAEAVILGLASATGHPFRERLDDVVDVRPPVVARAVDYLHDHVADPISVADVARHCGISVRSLQDGFSRHVGKSPSAYLRMLRVRGVHDELVEASPQRETVAAVAHRWGFVHLGRFASLYGAEFGETPSQTLRRVY